jgi:hypothetical protein
VTLLYLLILPLSIPKNEVRIEIRTPVWSMHLGSVISALFLATSPVFWQQATVAEVYTLNAFFVALLLLLLVTPVQQGAQTRALWLAFLTGLSLTHHRTMVFLLPALVLYIYLNRKVFHLTWQPLILGGLLGLAPLLLYLYLPWRGHVGSLDGTYQNTWVGFWRQISAGGYGTFIFDNPFGHERNAIFYWDLLRSQFYTLAPGFVGIFYLLWIGRRKMLALTGLAFLTYFGFNLFYQVTDIEVFFIPVFLIWAAWSGVGATFLLRIASGLKLVIWRAILTGIILAIFIFIIFQNIQATRPLLTKRNTWQVHDYGLDILQQPLDEQSAIVGILGEMTLLRYFQQTENRRPDLETVAADLEADRLAAVEKLLGEEKSVYLTRELSGAPERWSLGAVGPLIRINPEPVTDLPRGTTTLNQTITPEIALLGYTVSRPSHTGPGPAPVRLTLFWQTIAPLPADLKVSARLLNQTGELAAMVDAVPVHFAYPTTAWRPGEIVSDVYDLALPVDTPSGLYTSLLIWYDPVQNAAEAGRVELGAIMIDTGRF